MVEGNGDSKPVRLQSSVNLSPGQAEAIDAIKAWFTDPNGDQVFRMFGPAGTGKTTIARVVPEALGVSKYAFGAFSGKAAQVLRTKGCEPSGTLHSMIYGAPINLRAEKRKLENRLDFFLEVPEENRQPAHDELISSLRDAIKALDYKIRTNGALEFQPELDGLAGYDILIADEVSMVSDKMADDLLKTGVRILVLGDPEQLPPVRGDGYFTRYAADVMLSEIHRQALDSPVLSLATRIRTGGILSKADYTPGKSIDYTEFDQILCWRKKTRWSAIRYLRNKLGRPPGEPVPGDTIMNLQNNKDLSIFNGQIFTVLDIVDHEGEIWTLSLDDGSGPVEMQVYDYGFTEQGELEGEQARIGWRGEIAFATFSQALTVHKAQGSEWPNVLVVDETPAMYSMESSRNGHSTASALTRRWLYTAVTRASNSVTLVPKA